MGRDAVIAPPVSVHTKIVNGSTEPAAARRVYHDGVLWLDWGVSPAPPHLGP